MGRVSRLTACHACRKRTTELTEQLHKEETEQKRLEDEVAKLKAEIKALEAKLGDLRKHTKPDEKYALLALMPSVSSWTCTGWLVVMRKACTGSASLCQGVRLPWSCKLLEVESVSRCLPVIVDSMLSWLTGCDLVCADV